MMIVTSGKAYMGILCEGKVLNEHRDRYCPVPDEVLRAMTAMDHEDLK
jgi:hypothetical protein